jgi:DNA-binding NarL/FixJ family response regulator
MEIVIADAMPLVRAGLRVALAPLHEAIDFIEAGDADSLAATLTERRDADLVLTSTDLPGAADLGQLFRAMGDTTAQRVLTVAADDPALAIVALHKGAAGVVLKTSPSTIIRAAVQLVLAGGRYVSPDVFLGADTRPDCVSCARGFLEARATDAKSTAIDDLTARQREVLHLLGEGLSNKEVARQLGLTVGTVKIHVTRILQVLNAPSRARAIVLARRWSGTESRSPR